MQKAIVQRTQLSPFEQGWTFLRKARAPTRMSVVRKTLFTHDTTSYGTPNEQQVSAATSEEDA